jgi:hypothetical protein
VVAFAPAASSLTSTDTPMTAHDPDRLILDSFGISGVPSAILLGADGLLAGGPVTGGSAVQDFVASVEQELHLAADDLSTR